MDAINIAANRRVKIDYTNWRGERSKRTIYPQKVIFSASDHHYQVQWLLEAWCEDKRAIRLFAMKDIHAWDTTS